MTWLKFLMGIMFFNRYVFKLTLKMEVEIMMNIALLGFVVVGHSLLGRSGDMVFRY